jgi:hypothetical protein
MLDLSTHASGSLLVTVLTALAVAVVSVVSARMTTSVAKVVVVRRSGGLKD